jgi:hypothetical protein
MRSLPVDTKAVCSFADIRASISFGWEAAEIYRG